MKIKHDEKPSLPALVAIVAIILVAFSLCSCALSDSTYPPVTTTDPASADNHSTEDTTSSVLVDDKIKVSYIGCMDASSMGVFYVTLKIENSTDSEIVINLEDADVDGETIPLISTGVPLVIRPGNSGQTGFIFSMANLSITSMNEAAKATFSVVARNNDTYDIIYKSELVTVDLH